MNERERTLWEKIYDNKDKIFFFTTIFIFSIKIIRLEKNITKLDKDLLEFEKIYQRSFPMVKMKRLPMNSCR